MTGHRYSTEDIKAMLAADLDRLLGTLGIKGKWTGDWMVVSSPVRIDRNPSFGIRKNGSWKDFARAEDTGSVIDLIGYVALGQRTKGQRIEGRGEAFAWARRFLNIDRPLSAAELQAIQEANRARIEASQERARQDDERKARGAFKMWLDSHPRVIGTLGETYLTVGRGIPIARLPREPRAMRFRDRLRYQHRTPAGIDEEGEFSAIVTAMTNSKGQTRAVHRIWINADGTDKAPVSKPRKVWGDYQGCAMRLWRGESGLSEREASEQGLWDHLAFTEGVEDALSLALACPELRIWAVSSLSNLAAQELPECCGELTVLQDNDWDKPAAVAEFNRAMEILDRQARARRIKLSVARSSVGKDVNDLLRSKS